MIRALNSAVVNALRNLVVIAWGVGYLRSIWRRTLRRPGQYGARCMRCGWTVDRESMGDAVALIGQHALTCPERFEESS